MYTVFVQSFDTDDEITIETCRFTLKLFMIR